jgi:Fur family ferric uptake transcriptional regulator
MNAKSGNWPAGLKKTWQRETVLALLNEAEMPVSAAEISARAAEKGREISLATVYRILAFFEKKDVALKVEVPGNERALYEVNRFRHKHYAVCVACRKIISMDNCPMENFIPDIGSDFRVTGHSIEVYGYCGDCDSGSRRV